MLCVWMCLIYYTICMDVSELLYYEYGHVIVIILCVWTCLIYYTICDDMSELLYYKYGCV